MRYVKLVEGKIEFVRLADEFPQVINPHLLSDEELAPILRVEVTHEELGFYEKYGEPVLEGNTVRYPAVQYDLDEAKDIAWQRVKAEREERKAGLMPYDYGGEWGVLHNPLNERTCADLNASTTGALAMSAAGVTDAVLPWTTHENVTVLLTPDQMVEFGVAALQWLGAIHVRSQQMRTAIEAAEDVAGVVAAAEWGEE